MTAAQPRDRRVFRADGRLAFEHQPVFVTATLARQYGSYAAARKALEETEQ